MLKRDIEIAKVEIIFLTWIRVKRSPFAAYLDAVLSTLCTRAPCPRATLPERLMHSPHSPSHSLSGCMQACALVDRIDQDVPASP